jgi:hypothetical protein
MSQITATSPVRTPVAPPSRPRKLRLWPAVIIVAAQAIAITVPGWVMPGTFQHFMSVFWGPILATATLALWWLFASGVSWLDRLVTVVICIIAGGEVYSLSHPSLMPMGIFIFGLPLISTLAILWLLATPFLGWPTRRFGLWAARRSDGQPGWREGVSLGTDRRAEIPRRTGPGRILDRSGTNETRGNPGSGDRRLACFSWC